MARIALRMLFTLGLLWSGAAAAACPPLLDHTFRTLVSDQPVNLCQYEGKVVLVVNTASQCGYTPQYAGLEKLWKRYRDKGFVILGFPANDFGRQEPGSNKDIAQFCEENYGVSFPMFEKTADGQTLKDNPLYAKLVAASGKAPEWNFHKYLIDRTGKVRSWKSDIEPGSREVRGAVEAALAAPAPVAGKPRVG